MDAIGARARFAGMRALRVVTSLLASMALLGGDEASAQVSTREISIGIEVPGTKSTGEAWDPFGGAPDISICINSALGQECFAAGRAIVRMPGQVRRSLCPDRFRCNVTVTVPRRGPYSLTIFDVDNRFDANDPIGDCVVETATSRGPCGLAMIDARPAVTTTSVH